MHKIQQAVKWTVYTLLIINFVFYLFEDWNRAVLVLDADSTLLDWMGEFATSIDESAWFLLLIMFELETYILGDDTWGGWVAHTVRGLRLVAYAMIAHTIYAFTITIINLQTAIVVENVSTLCDIDDPDVSYVYNLEYTTLTDQNCAALSNASTFYWVADDPVVSDLAGLKLERQLALADLAEALIWLLILLAIEIVVHLQDRAVTGGLLITSANRIKLFLYLSLIAIGIYWAALSHWLYLWDELVWILGFAAIEMNISEWRAELQDQSELAT